MKTYNVIGKILLGALFLALASKTVTALWPDPEVAAGIINYMSNGVNAFKVGVISAGNWDVVDHNTTGARGLRVSGTDASVSFRGQTSAQISLLTPAAANEMVMNTDVPCLCVSTGTTQGAWVMFASTDTATKMAGTRRVCY